MNVEEIKELVKCTRFVVDLSILIITKCDASNKIEEEVKCSI